MFPLTMMFNVIHQTLCYCAQGRVLDGGAYKTGKIWLFDTLYNLYSCTPHTKTHFPLFLSSISIHILLPLPGWTQLDTEPLFFSLHLIILIQSEKPALFVFFHKSFVSLVGEVLMRSLPQVTGSSSSLLWRTISLFHSHRKWKCLGSDFVPHAF